MQFPALAPRVLSRTMSKVIVAAGASAGVGWAAVETVERELGRGGSD